MTVPLRPSDELCEAPALATLPALSACIEAFKAALEVSHPDLLRSPHALRSPREMAAGMLHMYLDACQHLLHEYDQLTFDGTYWYCPEEEGDVTRDPEDDLF